MRLFIAIHFSAEVQTKIERIQDKLRESAIRANFTARENLHLTLFFFGEGFDDRLPAIQRVLDALDEPAFALQIQGTGFFKRNQRDIWWVGVQENKHLARVHRQILTGIEREKLFPSQSRNLPFRPHITIAREVLMDQGNGISVHHGTPIIASVHDICLMKSERVSGRLIYTPIYHKQLHTK